MKAYVIKNKDGKFWQFLHNDKSEFVDDVYNAFFHYSKHDAEKAICSWGLIDCEVVEVTIAEGDLEEELTIYKRALELACVNVNCMDCCYFNCRKEPYNEKHNCIECGELGLTQKHLSKYFLDQAKKELEEKQDDR